VEEPLGRLDLDQSRHYAKVFGSDESTFCGTYDLKDKEAAVYRPLSATDSEIRLIKLKSATAPSDLLSCTLEHYLASNLPTYVALSYCWGKSLETRRSLVNGHDFQINTDLWSALLTLRACGDIQVWCDRLCINHADVVERAQQVGRMEIYLSERCKSSSLAWGRSG
jgi:hypothetical protein